MSYERLTPSFSITKEKLEQLKRIVPEAFADEKINWQVLREDLSDHLEEDGSDAEHFGLFWPGKREARRMAAIPSKGTLVPCPGDGIDEESTHNIFIEGENLEVLKILQKSYAGRIKMIYIDPPYNTGNDFVYEDDFREPLEDYLRRTGQVDEEGKPWSTNTRADGRFHSKWLSMMYPRLKLARNLLRDDGVIFISIDDIESHNLKLAASDIFGEENFVAEFVWEGAIKNDSRFVSVSHDYVLCFSKNKEHLRENDAYWRTRKEGIDAIYEKVNELKKKHGEQYEFISEELKDWYAQLSKNDPPWNHRHYNKVDKKGVYFPGDISWPGGGGPKYEILHPITRKPVRIPTSGWRFAKSETMLEAIQQERVEFGKDENKVPTLKRYLKETEGQVLASVIYKDRRSAMQRLRQLMGADVFENPKDEEVIQKFIEATTQEDEIILDFFAGSGTTSQSVLDLNNKDGGKRSFILVQIPEPCEPESVAFKNGYKNIAELCRERVRRTLGKIRREGRNGDFGFRAFRLAKSNFKYWLDYDGENLTELQSKFGLFETPFTEGWKPIDLLAEIMLIEGFPLDSKITPLKDHKKNTVHQVTSDFCEHQLKICLDTKISDETVSRMEFGENDVFVCLDNALTDQAKMRLADQCKLKTI